MNAPVAVVTVTVDGWTSVIPETVDLLRTIPPGTYSVYVTFRANSEGFAAGSNVFFYAFD